MTSSTDPFAEVAPIGSARTWAAPAAPALANVDAEKRLLGVMLADNRTVEWFADELEPRDFSDPTLGGIYELILRETSGGRGASPVLLAPYLVGNDAFADLGGMHMLSEACAEAQVEANPRALCGQVATLAAQRRLIDTLRSTIEAASAPGVDLEKVVSQADLALSSAVERRDAAVFHSAEDCFNEVLDSFDRKVVGVRSGVVEGIDRLIGAIRPGWLGILAARPGMGKTAAIVSYCRGAAQNGHAVLLASLEMTWGTLAMRLAADHLHAHGKPFPFEELMEGRLQPHHKQNIARASRDTADLPFRVVDRRCHTLGQLRRAIRRQKRVLATSGRKLDLVVVDYLQLLLPDREARSEFEAVSEVSRTLKLMAVDEDVAIIALSQLSRKVEERADKRPQLSDLRSSGQIEQDADFVIFLLAEEYYLKKAEPEPDTAEHIAWQDKMVKFGDVLEFICAKFRHGAEGVHYGRFYRRFQAVR